MPVRQGVTFFAGLQPEVSKTLQILYGLNVCALNAIGLEIHGRHALTQCYLFESIRGQVNSGALFNRLPSALIQASALTRLSNLQASI